MDTKYLFRTALLAVPLLAAVSCIYPFEPELPATSEHPLVVEGDIHLGGQTTLRLSHVRSLTEDGFAYDPIYCQGYIEGEDGTRIEGDTSPFVNEPGILDSGYGSALLIGNVGVNNLHFDTAGLTKVQRYRLHFDTLSESGNVLNTFESDWLDPCPAPTIDGLSYTTHEDLEELWIGLSMHCNGAHYFRWTFSEVWEYHSDLDSHLVWDRASWTMRSYDMRIDGYPSLYYCWKTSNSSQINIFSTANQKEDRFEELAFHRIARSDKRLQVMYHITVRLEAMSENAYNYWHNMQQVSEGQGSLFAPTPSEMASNIHCITDPGLQVIGYLGAGVQAVADMYYDNSQVKFYQSAGFYPRDDQTVSASRPDSMDYWYNRRYLPFNEIYEGLSDQPSAYVWTPGECIDCRRQGGTKTAPEGWPTGHK